MKAIVNTARGAAAENLHLLDIERPEPAPGEVRVAIRASGVNPSDCKLRSGAQGPMVADQVVVHNDGAGVVDAVGAGVDAARVGQPVWLYNVNRSPDGVGQGVRGTAAEYVCVRAALAAELPDGIDFDLGACLGVPAMTAHRALFWAGSLRDKTVLVSGGAGAVGHAAVQMAAAAGARVIATVSSDEKARIAAEAGAEIVLNYRQGDLADQIVAALGAKSIDHLVDVDLAAHIDMLPRIMCSGGTVGAYATASNLTPAMPFYPLAMSNIAIQPVFVYSLSQAQKDVAISDINDFLRVGKLKPRVAARFALSDAVQAHEAIEGNSLIGNAILEI
ncbi:NADPH:quinone reductase [Paracoccus sp. Z330]|uniref:NADPH:quinone reductase n=1 Tax=Paracoccus onchidii TaxID=3017813 RepID=A0ABT4ZF03_9RHOB|nr:NADPH:quinone reductase [Paracoccus onchidii]MDB6177270.1 NADPH:quinone reductase [Paracoccus onchidii]